MPAIGATIQCLFNNLIDAAGSFTSAAGFAGLLAQLFLALSYQALKV